MCSARCWRTCMNPLEITEAPAPVAVYFFMPKILAGDVELFYDERGAGEPILLIMGLATQMIAWEEAFCDQLASCGYRVIRFDNRDVGLSQRFEQIEPISLSSIILRAALNLSVDVPYTLSDMANDAVGILDALGIDSAHIVGASMGGMIGQIMAIEFPNRVKTLTSIMSHPGGRRSFMTFPRVLRVLLRQPSKTREGLIEHYVDVYRVLCGLPDQFDSDRIRTLAAMALDRHPVRGSLPRHIGAIMASGSRRKALRGLQTPTLMVHGTRDPLVRPYGARVMERLIPNARVEWIEDMGHELPTWAWSQIIGAISAHAGSDSAALAV